MVERSTGEVLYFGASCASRASGWTESQTKKSASKSTQDLINMFSVEYWASPEYQQVQKETAACNRMFGPGGKRRPYSRWRDLQARAALRALESFSQAERSVLLSVKGSVAGVNLSGLDSGQVPA